MSTWMVVEDEPGIYEVLLAMFELWGIEGAAFVDGEEAVAWIDDIDKSGDNRDPSELPELALLDIRLPGNISGAMVGARLRRSPYLKDIAVVLITAYKLSADEEKAVMAQSGADLLLYKPLPKFHELKRVLEEVISARRSKIDATKAVTRTLTPPKANTKPFASSGDTKTAEPIHKTPPKQDK